MNTMKVNRIGNSKVNIEYQIEVETYKGRKFKSETINTFDMNGNTCFYFKGQYYKLTSNTTFEPLKKVTTKKKSNTTKVTLTNTTFDVTLTTKEKTVTTTTEETPTTTTNKDYSKFMKHNKHKMILECIKSNVPVFLVGGAGSGKNFTLEQIAQELKMSFYFSNSVQHEFKLTGFIDAGGKYHETEFYKACKDASEGKEVMFFLDEIDASTPDVLILLNSAIANGYFEFPTGKLTFNKNIKFVSAGNTVGNGADDSYTGRCCLDMSSLDRFALIKFDYDMEIELAITGGNTDLVGMVEMLRARATTNQIRCVFSYRCLEQITALEKTSMKLEDILTITLLKGLDKDTANTLKFSSDVTCKYLKAFSKAIKGM